MEKSLAPLKSNWMQKMHYFDDYFFYLVDQISFLQILDSGHSLWGLHRFLVGDSVLLWGPVHWPGCVWSLWVCHLSKRKSTLMKSLGNNKWFWFKDKARLSCRTSALDIDQWSYTSVAAIYSNSHHQSWRPKRSLFLVSFWHVQARRLASLLPLSQRSAHLWHKTQSICIISTLLWNTLQLSFGLTTIHIWDCAREIL